MSKQTLAGPDVVIYHANNTQTGYTGGSPTSIEQAVSDSVSGDTIAVFASASITSNLAKNGVNWWFAPGVTVTWDNNATGFMWDDGGAAMTFSVGGSGKFVRNITNLTQNVDNTHGLIKTSNVSTVMSFEFDTLAIYSKANAGNKNCQDSLIYQAHGTIYGRGKKIMVENDEVSGLSVTYGIWWMDGDCDFIVNDIIAGPRNAAPYGANLIYPSAGVTVGELRVVCNTLDARIPDSNGAAFTSNSTGASARAWVAANTIYGYVQNVSNGGLNYVTAQKITGSCQCNGGTLYIDTMKIGGSLAAANGFSQHYLDCTAGTLRARVGHFDTGSNVTELVSVSGGTAHLTSQDITGITGQDAILVSGGVLNLLDGILTPASGKLSLKRTAGTLNVSAAVAYLAADTSGTITTRNLFGVVPGSTFKSTTIGA